MNPYALPARESTASGSASLCTAPPRGAEPPGERRPAWPGSRHGPGSLATPQDLGDLHLGHPQEIAWHTAGPVSDKRWHCDHALAYAAPAICMTRTLDERRALDGRRGPCQPGSNPRRRRGSRAKPKVAAMRSAGSSGKGSVWMPPCTRTSPGTGKSAASQSATASSPLMARD